MRIILKMKNHSNAELLQIWNPLNKALYLCAVFVDAIKLNSPSPWSVYESTPEHQIQNIITEYNAEYILKCVLQEAWED